MFVMPIHPLSYKGAFESPVNKISRLARGDMLFWEMNGINILHFSSGRHSSYLREVTGAFVGKGLEGGVK